MGTTHLIGYWIGYDGKISAATGTACGIGFESDPPIVHCARKAAISTNWQASTKTLLFLAVPAAQPVLRSSASAWSRNILSFRPPTLDQKSLIPIPIKPLTGRHFLRQPWDMLSVIQ